MKKSVAISLILLSTSALALHAADGKALYDKDCAKCHGADGKGETKMGKKYNAKDYTDAKVQDAVTDEKAFKAVKEGFKDKDGKVIMKPSEGLTDDDVKAIVKHLRSFKKA